MRSLLILLAAFVVPALAASPESPDTVRGLLETGAFELALARVEALQPHEATAPRWAEWEGLRCDILKRLARHAALIERVTALPPDATAAPLKLCLTEGARAALAEGQPALARAYAARLLWQMGPTLAETQAIRRAVIESYVIERRGEDAFRSMLRFYQDYQPLERRIEQHFAEALLELGLDREALNWAGEGGPPRVRLQLRGNLVTPEAAMTQARAALRRNADAGWWRVVLDAALRQRNRSAEIEALERLLQLVDQPVENPATERTQHLLQTYLAAAEEIGNREHLLIGDDGAWADYAARRAGSDPFLSRAFYAYLTQRAEDPGMRGNAQLQLAFSLYSTGLDVAALRLFGHMGLTPDQIDSQARYLLGTMAAAHDAPRRALELWAGITPPPNIDAEEWQIRLAQTALRAGDTQAAVSRVERLLAGRSAAQPDLVRRTLDLAQEMLDRGRLDAAQAVYELTLKVARETREREAWLGLGRVHELKGDAVTAAGLYLRSALLADARSTDALAVQARMLAAMNLVRAGYKSDARTQFEWLIKNGKDPAVTELARRELKKM